MPAKAIELKGYGILKINPINIKEQDVETVDTMGKPVTGELVGGRAKRVYTNSDGVQIPSSMLCKKFIVEDETIIAPKFSPTSEVPQDNISTLDENGLVYRALQRKFYNVVTDSQEIKDLLESGKSLSFPFVGGLGWKMWKAILTNWNGRPLLVACRGDLTKELEKYKDDTVEFELEVLPIQKNMKKLVKAMAMID